MPHRFARQAHQAAVGILLRQQQTVVAVADAEAFPAAIERREHDGADHRVEAGRVAAAGRDGDAFDRHKLSTHE